MVQELNFQAPIDPPKNLEVEEVVLGGILLDPTAIARIAESLNPEAFYLTAHQEIYRAALAIYHTGKPIDIMSVATWLLDRGLLDKVGGQTKLVSLLETVPHAVNIDYHAELISIAHFRRQMINVGQQISQLGHQTAKDIPTLLREVEQKVADLEGKRESVSVKPITQVLEETFSKIEERSIQNEPPGFLTGFIDLDAKTQGFQREDFIVVAGRPSMGKTAWSLECAKGVAKRHKVPVMFCTLEMSARQLTERLLSSMSKVELYKIRSGKLPKEDWEPLGHAYSELAQFPLFIDDAPYITVSELRSRAKRIIAEQGDLGVIFIDYIQLMNTGGGDMENRVQALSKLTRQLKQLARELNVCVVGLSQLSRSVESRSDKRPMMSDLRESGSIEQDSDLIMMLYREEYYNPDTVDRGIAEVIISKHRNGPTGTIKLIFDQKYTRFLNAVHV